MALDDVAVIDRQFKGEIAATMDHLTKRALQAQVEAAVSTLTLLVPQFHFDTLYRTWIARIAIR